MRLRALLPLLVLPGLLCLGLGRKPPLSIRFYALALEKDSDTFSAPLTLLNGQQSYVDQVATISEDDVVAIYPFQTADGTFGCALKLDTHGTIMLDQVSNDKRGSLLIATVNGRQVADIYIDARVTDGILTIPMGLQPDDLKQFLQKYPVLGTPKAKPKPKNGFDAGFN